MTKSRSARINIVCSDSRHPVMPWLENWCKEKSAQAEARIVSQLADADSAGDMLFLVSCQEIVDAGIRNRFRHVLVIHASDLPTGRGWSPLIWQVLAGERHIVVSLLEAADKVDSGRIWKKVSFEVEDHETLKEINEKLFKAELELMDYALHNMNSVQPVEQDEAQATYYPRRRPEDSELDLNLSIAEQFDKLRVADPDRYPCFIDYRGYRYTLVLEKLETLPGGERK